MKCLFDIGHPAEFHSFKNVIRNLIRRNHKVVITARDKDVTLYLLEKFGVQYFSTGKNLPSKLGKMYSLLRNDYKIYKVAKKFDPDIIVNFFSPFAAHIGKLLKKPVIGFHDTEKANISIQLSKSFTDIIVVPQCYKRKLPGKKRIAFKGVFELAYLHPTYFTPDSTVLDLLKMRKGEKYVLLRFVSHKALHDIGNKGMSLKNKRKAVEAFKKFANVFISSEEQLPIDLKRYEINIPPEKMHDVLYYAALIYGESATMASEGAVLGTPSIFVDRRGRGYTDELEQKYGLVFNFSNDLIAQEKSITKGIELLNIPNKEKQWQTKRAELLSDSIDITAFMLWLIEMYPRSVDIIKKNPGYLLNFK